MYIQGITFLVRVSKRLKFITIKRLKSQVRMEFVEKFDDIFRVYNQAGFMVSKIFTDPEFHILEKEFSGQQYQHGVCSSTGAHSRNRKNNQSD